MDRNDKSSDKVSSTLMSGGQEDPAGNAKLAQGIWDRYGQSPGVIPTGVTLGLVRRVTRLSIGRLPLLADIQRRWLAAGASFPLGLPALPYTWPTGFAGTMSMSTSMASPAPATGMPGFGQAGPAPPLASLAGVERVVSAPAAKERTSPERRAVERLSLHHTIGPGILKAKRALPHSSSGRRFQHSAGVRDSISMVSSRGADPLVSPGKEAPMSQPAATESQPGSETLTGISIPTGSGKSGPAIVRRQPDDPAEGAIQHKAGSSEPGLPEGCVPAAGSPRPARSFISRGDSSLEYRPEKETPNLQPSPGKVHHGTEARDARPQMPITSSPDDLGAAILQRFMYGPAGRVMEPMPGMYEPGRPANRGTRDLLQRAEGTMSGRYMGPLTSMTMETPKVRPGARKVRHGSDAQAKEPITTGPDDLGAAILQRFMYGPAGRVMEPMPGMHEPGRPANRGTRDLLQRAEGTMMGRYMGPLTSMTMETPKVRPGARKVRHGSDAQAKEPITTGPDDLGAAILQRFMYGPAGQAMPRMRGMSEPGRPGAGGIDTGDIFDVLRGAEGPVAAASPEPRHVGQGAGGEQLCTTMGHAQANTSSVALSMPLLQRAAAESQAAMPETNAPADVPFQSGDELSLPTTAESNPNQINLERLADEVYAIIEQRITIERERLGLS